MAKTFGTLDAVIADCAIINDSMQILDCDAGHTILIEEDDSTQIYFILSGSVKITSFQASGKEVWHAQLTEGQTFGELAAITNTPRSASVAALTPCKFGILSQANFLRVLKSDAKISMYFLETLAARLQAATFHTNDIVGRDITGRICAELVRNIDSEKRLEDGSYRVSRELTVTALAMRLNASRETISRTISNLKDAQHIKKQGRQFYILDKDALGRRAIGESYHPRWHFTSKLRP